MKVTEKDVAAVADLANLFLTTGRLDSHLLLPFFSDTLPFFLCRLLMVWRSF